MPENSRFRRSLRQTAASEHRQILESRQASARLPRPLPTASSPAGSFPTRPPPPTDSRKPTSSSAPTPRPIHASADFYLFSRLPKELRRQIWEEAYENECERRIVVLDSATMCARPTSAHCSALLSASRESRDAVTRPRGRPAICLSVQRCDMLRIPQPRVSHIIRGVQLKPPCALQGELKVGLVHRGAVYLDPERDRFVVARPQGIRTCYVHPAICAHAQARARKRQRVRELERAALARLLGLGTPRASGAHMQHSGLGLLDAQILWHRATVLWGEFEACIDAGTDVLAEWESLALWQTEPLNDAQIASIRRAGLFSQGYPDARDHWLAPQSVLSRARDDFGFAGADEGLCIVHDSESCYARMLYEYQRGDDVLTGWRRCVFSSRDALETELATRARENCIWTRVARIVMGKWGLSPLQPLVDGCVKLWQILVQAVSI